LDREWEHRIRTKTRQEMFGRRPCRPGAVNPATKDAEFDARLRSAVWPARSSAPISIGTRPFPPGTPSGTMPNPPRRNSHHSLSPKLASCNAGTTSVTL
jgi:hypothetical protein